MKRIVYKTIDASVNQRGAMEPGCHFKNRTSSKSQPKGNWKLFALFILFIFTTCDKAIVPDKADVSPEYIGMAPFGDEFDFAILGLDGFGYFYEFQEEKPIPKRLAIYDGNKGNVGLVINFDEEGLPKNILSEDFTVVLGKYEGNRFNAVLITKDGETNVMENIETDVSWDEYKKGLLSIGLLEATSQISLRGGWLADLWNDAIKSGEDALKWTEKNILKPVIKATNTVASAVACGAGIGLSTTGWGAIIGAPLALYGCANMVLNGAELLDLLGIIDYESPQVIEDIRRYGGDLFQKCIMSFITPWSAVGCAVEIIRNAADNNENSAKDDIKKGEEIVAGNATTGGPGVYVSGYVDGRALLWKNGIAQYLTDGTNWSNANSVFVSGSDVYVAGNENSKAVLWKNGVPQILIDGTMVYSDAYSVFVSGSDVYVAGYRYTSWQLGDYTAVLWKNGVTQNLTFDEKYPSIAHSVFVSGSDVYVAGTNNEIVFWKNGVPQILTNGLNGYSLSKCYSIFVSGNDVYVAGYNDRIAVLWKNGVAQNLTDGIASANAKSVFVSGSDVYVAGDNSTYAILWKNGVEQNLSNGQYANAESVYVLDNDVYVAGWQGGRAVLWKNGEVQYLTDNIGQVFVTSVYVVK